MKYKLINKTTGTEHFCIIVTVDGFDYYVNDEIAKNGDKLFLLRDNLLGKMGDIITVVSTKFSRTDIIKADGTPHWFASDTAYQREWSWKKIIATTNPSIDIPKVIDEGVKSAKEQQAFELETGRTLEAALCIKMGFLLGYNKSQETHSNSDEDMIEFVEILSRDYEQLLTGEGVKWRNPSTLEVYFTKDLFNIWKEQKVKTIYYE